MNKLDFGLTPSHKKATPKKGRRSGGQTDLDLSEDVPVSTLNSPSRSGAKIDEETSLDSDLEEEVPILQKMLKAIHPASSIPNRRKSMGWASSAKGGSFGPPPDDHRFQQTDDGDMDIPVIPDLEEVYEEDFTQQVAQAPNVQVNRVATFKELDSDLLRHAAFSTLDDIDLRLLTSALYNETDVREPDVEWRWDPLFAEVSSDLLNEWEGQQDATSVKEEEPM